MAKATNQVMVKDTHRDMKYTGTMKCMKCGEESNLPEMYGFTVQSMVDQLKAFSKMHDIKGCNKKKVESPEWASGEINMAFAVG